MLNGLITEVTFTSVILEEPDVLKCTNLDGETVFYTLGKEAINFLYNRMDIPFSMSKKLYEASKELWLDLRQKRLYDNPDVKGLSKYRYVICSNAVVMAIFDENYAEIDIQYDLFDVTFNKATLTINKAGVIQLYDEVIASPDGDKSALLLVDLDPIHGIYRAYNGITVDDYMILLSLPIIETESFFNFMTSFDASIEEDMAIKMTPHTLMAFRDDTLENVEVSVREVVDMIKKSKCLVTLDKNKNLVSLDLVGSDELVQFLNSFGMPYKSLTKLENLKKSLTYGKFTFLQLLKILSQNYKRSSNLIDSKLISEYLKPYFDQRTDRNITDECIPEIN